MLQFIRYDEGYIEVVKVNPTLRKTSYEFFLHISLEKKKKSKTPTTSFFILEAKHVTSRTM
jgi:hypothetical protein